MSFFTIFDILNNSKYFSGFIMILMNLGSKYVPLELSEEQEEFLSKKVIRRLLVFAIFFMATRDVLVSIILTGIFILFIGSLLNDNSKFCLIKKRNPKTKIIGPKKPSQSQRCCTGECMAQDEKMLF